MRIIMSGSFIGEKGKAKRKIREKISSRIFRVATEIMAWVRYISLSFGLLKLKITEAHLEEMKCEISSVRITSFVNVYYES